MRILHILDHSLPLHSGYAFRTAAILREQRALGWETAHLTTPRHRSANRGLPVEEAGGWRFHRTQVRRNALSRAPGAIYVQEMAATARQLSRLVQVFRPHVLHAHSPVLNVLPALHIGRRFGIPVAYELRASWEDAAVDHGTTREGSARYRLSRALETFALRRVDHVTTICDGLRHDIESRGIPGARITVIPNAVDTKEFRFGNEPDLALRTRLGLDGCTVLGFAGSFYGYEGLDLLIEAMAQLVPARPDLRLLLVGGGPQESLLREQALRLNLGDHVIFTGRVPHDDVQRYYDLIDVLAYPRRRMRLTEMVTPLKPLEAMAQGRMFVASDVGGHRELIDHGRTGILFAADDLAALVAAIDGVLRRVDQWPSVRDQARRFVETERTWARSVRGYVDVYAALTAPRDAAHARLANRGS